MTAGFQPFEYEVNGQTVWSVVDGFGAFTLVGSEFLATEGIGRLERDGTFELDRDAWYPREAWLRAFERIGRTIGSFALFQIGATIPNNAAFPPWVVDVDSALRSIDIAYHMNHRRNGEPMFNPATGMMLDGIGHYAFERVDRTLARIHSNTPYPCDFDRGIVSAMATKFDAKASLSHVSSECRMRGGSTCTYAVQHA